MGGWYTTGGEYVGQFRKAAGNVHLLAKNTTFIARPGSPEERSVKNSFSDSLLGSAPIASAPHPERKSILIDANALLMTDMPRASYVIERAYRNSFAFDARNSFIQSAKANDERTVFDVTAHYAQPRIPVPHRRRLLPARRRRRFIRRRSCWKTRAACSSAFCTRLPSCRKFRCGHGSPIHALGTSDAEGRLQR